MEGAIAFCNNQLMLHSRMGLERMLSNVVNGCHWLRASPKDETMPQIALQEPLEGDQRKVLKPYVVRKRKYAFSQNPATR